MSDHLTKALAEALRELADGVRRNPASWRPTDLIAQADEALAKFDAAQQPAQAVPPLLRPACFEFALDFLGEPEKGEIEAYIRALEARALMGIK